MSRSLESRRALGVQLDLEAIDAVHRAMGRPTAGRPTVHLVGTNGKGSTATLLEHALRRRGWRTGLYTSPHLLELRERIRIDGTPVASDALEAELEAVSTQEQRVGPSRPLSFFEALTLAGLAVFERAEVDVAVVEAGLGGGRDATRIVDAHAVVITSIGLDHRAAIGPELVDITREKAGAMAVGVPTFSAPQRPEVAQVLRAHADALDCPLRFVDPWPTPPRGMRGAHQGINAALAEAVGLQLEPGLVRADLDDVSVPGRLEPLPTETGALWVDVAHNPPSIAALVAAIHAGDGPRPDAILFGCHPDKARAPMLERLASLGCPIGWTPVGDDAEDEPPKSWPGPSFRGVDDPRLRAWLREQLDAGRCVLCCGSFVVVGTVRAWALGDDTPPEAQDPRPRVHRVDDRSGVA